MDLRYCVKTQSQILKLKQNHRMVWVARDLLKLLSLKLLKVHGHGYLVLHETIFTLYAAKLGVKWLG